MGDSCAQGGKPGIKETGTPEGVPRTAAITHACWQKKSAGKRDGALLRLEELGLPHPVAEFAATAEGYRERSSPATTDSLGLNPAIHEMTHEALRAGVLTDGLLGNRSLQMRISA